MLVPFDNYFIRSFRYEDAEALVKYANNINVARYLRDGFPYPYTRLDAEHWIDYVIHADPEYNFAIADSRELIGGIGVVPQIDVNRYSGEIGYWLGEPFWHKGIATKAVNVFCNVVFAQFSFNRLFAYVFEGNEHSQKVLENCGFRLEGRMKKAVFKNKKFIDQFIYALLKEENKL